MNRGRSLAGIAVGVVVLGAGSMHLDLIDSRPKQDEVVAEPPTEIWLRFNAPPDVQQSGISLRGPGGGVRLDTVRLADSLSLSARILDPLRPGDYTVAWLAAPHDDHGIRGRYRFTVAGAGSQ